MAKTTTGNLIPSTVNTPLDARTRINTLADAANIENPVLGGIFYCIETGKHYRITSLKAKTIGALTVENAAVNIYEEIPAISEVSSLSGRMTDAETAIGTKAAQSDLTALSGRMTAAEGSIAEHTTAIGTKAAASDLTALAGRMTSAESAISGKAEQSDLSDLSVRVGAAETAIGTKAASSDVTALTGRMTTAEGTIADHTTAISGKAAQSDLTALAGRVTSAEGTIADHTTAIAAKASASDVSALAQRMTAAETAIGGNASSGDVSALDARMTAAESAISGKASSSDLTALSGRVTDAETAIGTKAAASDVTALAGRMTTAEGTIADHTTAIAGKAAASDVTALSGRMTAAETAISSKAAASDLNTLAGTLSTLETEARAAWGNLIGVGNIKGTYAVEVIGYEESGNDYILLLSPDNEDLDLTKFETGDTVTLSLCTGITSTDPETSEQTTAYTLTEAEIASVDDTNKKIYLTASLYQGDINSSKQIGWEKKTVSGYNGSATGGASSYRVTLSGAGSDDELRVGRKIYTRAGSGALAANTIAGTSGNYLYLSSAAAGTTAIYLGPSNVFISNGKPEEDDNTLICAGEYNFVSGEASSVRGSYNTVIGTGSEASGSGNIVTGDFSHAHGVNNHVFGGQSIAVGEGNIIIDGMSVAIGSKNKLLYQGQFSFGTGNILTDVNSWAFGWNNTISGNSAISVGTLNKISGKYSFAVGYNNTIASNSTYVIGRYANVEKSIPNKNALLVHGGSLSDNGTALAVRTLKAVENPQYVQGGTEEEYIEETAFSTEYRGRLKAITLTISTVGTIELDHDKYARWEFTGTGAVTLTLANWQDGDRGEVVIDTTKQTFSIPAAWVVPDDVWDEWTDNPGTYCMEIRMEGGTVYAHAAVPFNTGGSSSGDNWQSTDVTRDWTVLTYAASLALSTASGPRQKLTLGGNVTLTAPTLDADHTELTLEIIKSNSNYTFAIGGVTIMANETVLLSWYWDGATTRRLPNVYLGD